MNKIRRLKDLFKSKKATINTLLLGVALIMTIVMFTNFLSPQLVAAALPISKDAESIEEYPESDFEPEKEEMTDEAGETVEESEEIYLVGENPERRTATQKNYILSDGTYVMQDYGADVHYYEDGKWQDIDNTVKEEEGVYKNTSNSMKVSFAKTSDSGTKLITLEENGIEISMDYVGAGKNGVTLQADSMLNAQQKAAKVADFEGKYKETSAFQKKSDVFEGQELNFKDEKQRSALNDILYKTSETVQYKSLLNNTEFEYVLEGKKLKENIILNAAPRSYTFSFSLSLTNAEAVMTEEGDIAIYDKEGTLVYHIPKGYMFDAEGNYSYGVSYTLLEEKDGYSFNVIIDEEWATAPERAFPVVVDPTIVTVSSNYSIGSYLEDLNNPYSNGYSSTFITSASWRSSSNYITKYAYIKYNSLTFENYLIKNAKLSINTSSYVYKKYNFLGIVTQNLSTSGRFALSLSALTGPWEDYNNIYHVYSYLLIMRKNLLHNLVQLK